VARAGGRKRAATVVGGDVEIRTLTAQRELNECVELQRRTWGRSFADVVPPSILKISQRLGGVAAGAFDERGRMLGFVYGMTGIENGTIVHWSDMLAVVPEAQNHGVGRKLKEFQRAAVAEAGARVIYWTYDPLVARNAHLNLNVFGVRVVEYVENMYGESRSKLHRLGTDRLIVAWPVNDAELAARRAEIGRVEAEARSRDVRGMRTIEIPADIHKLQKTSMQKAVKSRRSIRAAFVDAFAAGFAVNGFIVDEKRGVGQYLLTR
jgi:predicted GNAT superfamily acetyltransferase